MTYKLEFPIRSPDDQPSISVPENKIDYTYWDDINKIGFQLIGRNVLNYGTAVGQNTIQMISNFAGPNLPSDSIALQGQLWFNATSGTDGALFVRHTRNPTGGILNWRKLVTVPSDQTGRVPIVNPAPGTEQPGDILIDGDIIYIRGSTGWKQVFPAVYS